MLSYIAKGSFGPILKVKDKARQKTYAVKVSLSSKVSKHNHLYCYCSFLICLIQQVIPKAEILRLGVLEQSKEEVIIQVSNQNWSFKIDFNKTKSLKMLRY